MVETVGEVKMVTKLIGAKIEQKSAAEILKALRDLKRRQTVGLAITPTALALIASTYLRVDKDFMEFKRTQEGAAKSELKKLPTSTREAWENIEANESWLLFYYKVFVGVKKAGGQCVALGSDRIEREILRSDLSSTPENLLGAIRQIHKANLFEVPVTENFIAKEIIKKRPDYAVMGLLHVRSVKQILAKKGYSSTVFFKQKVPLKMKPWVMAGKIEGAFLRSVYREHKAKKIRRRLKKFARRR